VRGRIGLTADFRLNLGLEAMQAIDKIFLQPAIEANFFEQAAHQSAGESKREGEAETTAAIAGRKLGSALIAESRDGLPCN
jgi:hypothetical protein